MTGASHHNSKKGAAASIPIGLNSSTTALTPTTTADERPKGLARFFSAWVAPALACRAVTHFNNLRRVMNKRTKV